MAGGDSLAVLTVAADMEEGHCCIVSPCHDAYRIAHSR